MGNFENKNPGLSSPLRRIAQIAINTDSDTWGFVPRMVKVSADATLTLTPLDSDGSISEALQGGIWHPIRISAVGVVAPTGITISIGE